MKRKRLTVNIENLKSIVCFGARFISFHIAALCLQAKGLLKEKLKKEPEMAQFIITFLI
ncbi:hypothetical protein [Apibacter sp.]|uniref:hypothetical protein n=1 Tax=Apibacter sp. TaxID=2023709 RepID=UPI0025DDFF64|nr:hypothetical protein [Apibacter sp.]MCT6869872.1 hypothetical protein [Apibacter sp.]